MPSLEHHMHICIQQSHALLGRQHDQVLCGMREMLQFHADDVPGTKALAWASGCAHAKMHVAYCMRPKQQYTALYQLRLLREMTDRHILRNAPYARVCASAHATVPRAGYEPSTAQVHAVLHGDSSTA